MENFENLANAIVLQAVKDYRKTLKLCMEHPNYDKFKDGREEIETFFRSDWYKNLTELDGEWLIEKIREDVGYEC